jgi:hypothetical protein
MTSRTPIGVVTCLSSRPSASKVLLTTRPTISELWFAICFSPSCRVWSFLSLRIKRDTNVGSRPENQKWSILLNGGGFVPSHLCMVTGNNSQIHTNYSNLWLVYMFFNLIKIKSHNLLTWITTLERQQNIKERIQDLILIRLPLYKILCNFSYCTYTYEYIMQPHCMICLHDLYSI